MADGFELTRDLVHVVVTDATSGKTFKLRHTLRIPKDDASWVAYAREESAMRISGGEIVSGDASAARIALWEECIQDVDPRYLWQGQPVMQQADWKKKIPVAHKDLAVKAMLRVHAEVIDGPLA